MVPLAVFGLSASSLRLWTEITLLCTAHGKEGTLALPWAMCSFWASNLTQAGCDVSFKFSLSDFVYVRMHASVREYLSVCAVQRLRSVSFAGAMPIAGSSDRTFHWPELADKTRLAGQGGPGILLSRPPQCWAHKCTALCLASLCGLCGHSSLHVCTANASTTEPSRQFLDHSYFNNKHFSRLLRMGFPSHPYPGKSLLFITLCTCLLWVLIACPSPECPEQMLTQVASSAG